MEEVIHYGSYKFTITDWIIFLFGFGIKGFLISYLFYDSYVAIFMLIPFGYMDYRNEKLRKIEKRKQQISNQFKEMLESLIAFLNAGYSLEYSMKHTRKDLELLFQDKSLLLRELDILLEGLKMNIPIENLLKDFGKRSEVEDIRNFANVVMVAKKNGGNMIRIIEKAIHNITDKIAVEEEIKTTIAAKQLEQKIMMIMPYGIIFYLRVTNGDFLEILYHNIFGVLIMTLFLFIIYIADMWAKKIVEIHV